MIFLGIGGYGMQDSALDEVRLSREGWTQRENFLCVKQEGLIRLLSLVCLSVCLC